MTNTEFKHIMIHRCLNNWIAYQQHGRNQTFREEKKIWQHKLMLWSPPPNFPSLKHSDIRCRMWWQMFPGHSSQWWTRQTRRAVAVITHLIFSPHSCLGIIPQSRPCDLCTTPFRLRWTAGQRHPLHRQDISIQNSSAYVTMHCTWLIFCVRKITVLALQVRDMTDIKMKYGKSGDKTAWGRASWKIRRQNSSKS